jgi:sugar lactone lactonase YvrE
MGGMSAPRLAFAHRADVGEGPYWDAARGRLLWTDITAGEVHAYNPSNTTDTVVLQLDEPIGAAIPATTGELVLALRGTIAAFDEETEVLRTLATVEPDTAFRFNDASVDPEGRFVAGTMGYEPRPGTAGLYRLERDCSVTTLLDGVGLSNGMCWSRDGAYLYFVESLSRQIRVYDYGDAPLEEPTHVIAIPEGAGTPDGLTMDSDGNLWLALWGGGAVWQLTPTGDRLATIELPVSQVTSVGFAGEGSHHLYITSAVHQLPAEQRARQPLAGSLFEVRVDAAGLPERTVVLDERIPCMSP